MRTISIVNVTERKAKQTRHISNDFPNVFRVNFGILLLFPPTVHYYFYAAL